MLSEPQRQTIVELHAKGLSVRQISRTLGHARPTVRQVLAQGAVRPPSNRRPAPSMPELTSQLPALYGEARGNVVRMQELLREQHGAEVPYSTISHWLGHASVTTTNRYASVDLDMKRQAIESAAALENPPMATHWRTDASILEWLAAL